MISPDELEDESMETTGKVKRFQKSLRVKDSLKGVLFLELGGGGRFPEFEG